MKEVNILKKIQLLHSTAAKFYPRCICNLVLSQMVLMSFPNGKLADWITYLNKERSGQPPPLPKRQFNNAHQKQESLLLLEIRNFYFSHRYLLCSYTASSWSSVIYSVLMSPGLEAASGGGRWSLPLGIEAHLFISNGSSPNNVHKLQRKVFYSSLAFFLFYPSFLSFCFLSKLVTLFLSFKCK